MTIVATGEAITGIYFSDQRHRPKDAALGDHVDDDALVDAAASQLVEYLAGDRTDFDLPVHTHGDAFHQAVWNALRGIPFGTTTTYGQVAAEIGMPQQAQRVGQAVGRNPVGIVIPCHRVIGADGSLTGYAGGLQRKRWLLELEEPKEIRASRLF
nr:methylated-DNA--[protein]-cysteine S-methyltransferase [Gordonia sputi]